MAAQRSRATRDRALRLHARSRVALGGALCERRRRLHGGRRCLHASVAADGCAVGNLQNNWATAQRITTAISSYTEQLGVSKEKSYALYKEHGTCLKGMLAEGIISDGLVEDYLEKVHDIDYSDIDPDPAVRDVISRCVTKDRRFVFTASTKEHASRCLARVLAPSTVDDLFSVIVDTRTCKLDTKHSPASFAAAMDAAGVPSDVRASGPAACILLDDSVTNIKCAKQMGWTTVLVVRK